MNLPWKESIVKALSESEGGMRSQDIAQVIAEREYRTSLGATPAQTVTAVITTSINSEAAGSPFERVERGVYKLRDVSAATASYSQRRETEEEDETQSGLIKSFGMYWRRDQVNWNGGRQLLGRQTEGSLRINFSDQIGIYVLYDRDRPVYVGRATDGTIYDRLRSHTKGRFSNRWDRFSWFGCKAPNDSGALQPATGNIPLQNVIESLEAVLIEILEPPQNRRRGDYVSGVEYEQVEDPTLTDAQILQRVLGMLQLNQAR